MPPKDYYLKNYYKTLAIFTCLFSFTAAVINIAFDGPSFLLMSFLLFVGIFQYRWSSKPYIQINDSILKIQLSVIASKTMDLNAVSRIETPKDKKLILYPNKGKKLTIPLTIIRIEDKERLIIDIIGIVDNNQEGDLSSHLIDIE